MYSALNYYMKTRLNVNKSPKFHPFFGATIVYTDVCTYNDSVNTNDIAQYVLYTCQKTRNALSEYCTIHVTYDSKHNAISI